MSVNSSQITFDYNRGQVEIMCASFEDLEVLSNSKGDYSCSQAEAI